MPAIKIHPFYYMCRTFYFWIWGKWTSPFRGDDNWTSRKSINKNNCRKNQSTVGIKNNYLL